MTLVSLFIPAPANIYNTRNTFVRFFSNNREEDVGLIVDINPQMQMVSVRRFMTWTQLSGLLGDHIFHNISFWPTNSPNNPIFLCDTDLTVTISINTLRGLAFVFYVDDHLVPQIHGMANTFVVSSVFNHSEMSITHTRSFLSFPSLYAENRLVSCFPTMIFRQLLGIKQRLQHLLSSRSKTAKCFQSCVVSNVDPLTWEYITSVLMAQYSYRNVVVKKSYVCKDEFLLEKYRSLQVSVLLICLCHLPMVQKLFGTAIGLGTQKVLRGFLKHKGNST